jgi:hypothetical protein
MFAVGVVEGVAEDLVGCVVDGLVEGVVEGIVEVVVDGFAEGLVAVAEVGRLFDTVLVRDCCSSASRGEYKQVIPSIRDGRGSSDEWR